MRGQILDMLSRLEIDYELVDHEPIFTIGALDDMEVVEKEKIAKNLFLRNDNGKQHYLVVVRQDKIVDLKALRAKIGSSRLSFASEERLMKHLKLSKGSVSPLGIINNEDRKVIVYIDEDLTDYDRIGVHPNENTGTVWISAKSIEKVVKNHGNPLFYIAIE